MHISKIAPDDVMVVLPSDHVIADSKKYLDIIRAAARTASEEDGLVTIGIKPSSVQTGFGYIERADSFKQIAGEEVFRVKSIREKPDFQQAQEFMQSGKFYWNSGMFIWKTSAILKEISRWLPDLYSGLMKIKEALGSPEEAVIVPRVYKKLASISIDYGVMEKADKVFMLEGDFGWSDVGSWDTLWEISPKDTERQCRLERQPHDSGRFRKFSGLRSAKTDCTVGNKRFDNSRNKRCFADMQKRPLSGCQKDR